LDEFVQTTGYIGYRRFDTAEHQAVSALMGMNQRKMLIRHQSIADAALENI
jgi:hypothetical protein